jgi:hypothetical protein
MRWLELYQNQVHDPKTCCSNLFTFRFSQSFQILRSSRTTSGAKNAPRVKGLQVQANPDSELYTGRVDRHITGCHVLHPNPITLQGSHFL